jgi:hypothetical protein
VVGRLPDKRTRVLPIGSEDLLAKTPPESVDMEKIVYKREKKSVRVADGERVAQFCERPMSMVAIGIAMSKLEARINPSTRRDKTAGWNCRRTDRR